VNLRGKKKSKLRLREAGKIILKYKKIKNKTVRKQNRHGKDFVGPKNQNFTRNCLPKKRGCMCIREEQSIKKKKSKFKIP